MMNKKQCLYDLTSLFCMSQEEFFGDENFELIPDESDKIEIMAKRLDQRDEIMNKWKEDHEKLQMMIAEMTLKSQSLLGQGLEGAKQTIADLIIAVEQLGNCLETNTKLGQELIKEQIEAEYDFEMMLREFEKDLPDNM